MSRLANKVALVIGGVGGIGGAVSQRFASEGAQVYATSRKGGEAGTLYVMDADPDDVEPIGDGEVVSPHAMDPHTVLRFVKTVGGWPGAVRRSEGISRSPNQYRCPRHRA